MPKTKSADDLRWYFSGFPEGKTSLVRLPNQLFTELLPHIDDLPELQVTLLVLWRLARRRAQVAPWITEGELLADAIVNQTLGADAPATLSYALERAVRRGSLLQVAWQRRDGKREWRYLANSHRGRMAAAALQRGVESAQASIQERPNIYTLYEENIGPLTALLSEDLQDAEETYPAAWIEEAFREAVRLNKRSWKYIHAILKAWQTEGKDEIHKRASATDGQQYITGEYADFIQH
ncbi:MAG: DnaD domain protein [Chloroflexota bacterium]|nr:DnaD domain protein [Chloroflexota bacterium]